MLRDLCLAQISLTPARCLRARGSDDTHGALLLANPETVPFVRCAPATGAPAAGAKSAWADCWAGIEPATAGARAGAQRPEARPQIARFLAARGALVDGALPARFFEGLRVDALSLAACRGREPFALLAAAQARQPAGETLVALDLGSCLRLDDAVLEALLGACGATLERLCLRDSRKLTDAAFGTLAAAAPRLVDVDVGGNFNMTAAAAAAYVRAVAGDAAPLAAVASPPRKRARRGEAEAPEPEPVVEGRLLGLAASGLKVNDALLAALAGSAPNLRRLGCGFGYFSSAGFASAVAGLRHLVDVRVQWSKRFEDDALDALAAHCDSLRALDALGTPVTVDAADRFLRAKVHDDALGRRPDRRLEYLNVRYTAGPKAQLDALPENWKYAAVTVVVGA